MCHIVTLVKHFQHNEQEKASVQTIITATRSSCFHLGPFVGWLVSQGIIHRS